MNQSETKKSKFNQDNDISEKSFNIENETVDQSCQTVDPYGSQEQVDQIFREFFSEEFMEDLEGILQRSLFSSKMLLNLVNDLLDLAKIEQNTFQFNEEYFDLIETIDNAFG